MGKLTPSEISRMSLREKLESARMMYEALKDPTNNNGQVYKPDPSISEFADTEFHRGTPDPWSNKYTMMNLAFLSKTFGYPLNLFFERDKKPTKRGLNTDIDRIVQDTVSALGRSKYIDQYLGGDSSLWDNYARQISVKVNPDMPSNAAGRALFDEGTIELSKDLFRPGVMNTNDKQRVVSHEIGHMFDNFTYNLSALGIAPAISTTTNHSSIMDRLFDYSGAPYEDRTFRRMYGDYMDYKDTARQALKQEGFADAVSSRFMHDNQDKYMAQQKMWDSLPVPVTTKFMEGYGPAKYGLSYKGLDSYKAIERLLNSINTPAEEFFPGEASGEHRKAIRQVVWDIRNRDKRFAGERNIPEETFNRNLFGVDVLYNSYTGTPVVSARKSLWE